MATRANKKSYGGSTGRPKPVTPKSGTTSNGKRKYGCGGKIKK